jgi:hypothetical protein
MISFRMIAGLQDRDADTSMDARADEYPAILQSLNFSECNMRLMRRRRWISVVIPVVEPVARRWNAYRKSFPGPASRRGARLSG